jgi:ribulose-5-phosphate 4-epimerase/fuculose-1-phosphate aldolase
VDSTALLDLFLDIPCSDTMPSGFNAHASILRGVAVVGSDRLVCNFGVKGCGFRLHMALHSISADFCQARKRPCRPPCAPVAGL